MQRVGQSPKKLTHYQPLLYYDINDYGVIVSVNVLD